MKNLLLSILICCSSVLCAQYHRSAQDSFVRYIDKFLKMDPDFKLEFKQNLNWGEYAESISCYLELGGEEWDPKDEYPELLSHYGDLISEYLAREIVEQKFAKIYTQYFVKVECWYHRGENSFWMIHIYAYFN